MIDKLIAHLTVINVGGAVSIASVARLRHGGGIEACQCRLNQPVPDRDITVLRPDRRHAGRAGPL